MEDIEATVETNNDTSVEDKKMIDRVTLNPDMEIDTEEGIDTPAVVDIEAAVEANNDPRVGDEEMIDQVTVLFPPKEYEGLCQVMIMLSPFCCCYFKKTF